MSLSKTHTDCKQILNRKQSTKKKVLSRNFEGKFSRHMPNVHSGFCFGFAGAPLRHKELFCTGYYTVSKIITNYRKMENWLVLVIFMLPLVNNKCADSSPDC